MHSCLLQNRTDLLFLHWQILFERMALLYKAHISQYIDVNSAYVTISFEGLACEIERVTARGQSIAFVSPSDVTHWNKALGTRRMCPIL